MKRGGGLEVILLRVSIYDVVSNFRNSFGQCWDLRGTGRVPPFPQPCSIQQCLLKARLPHRTQSFSLYLQHLPQFGPTALARITLQPASKVSLSFLPPMIPPSFHWECSQILAHFLKFLEPISPFLCFSISLFSPLTSAWPARSPQPSTVHRVRQI